MTPVLIHSVALESQGELVTIYTDKEKMIGKFNMEEVAIQIGCETNVWSFISNGSTLLLLGEDLNHIAQGIDLSEI